MAEEFNVLTNRTAGRLMWVLDDYDSARSQRAGLDRGRLTVLVQATSDEAAGNSTPGTQCYPAELLRPLNNTDGTPDVLGDVWLTVLGADSEPVAPIANQPYVGLLSGCLTIGNVTKPRVWAVEVAGDGNFPDCSHTQRGAVNLFDQYLGAGNKTFERGVYIGDGMDRDPDGNTPLGNSGVAVAPWYTWQVNGNYTHSKPLDVAAVNAAANQPLSGISAPTEHAGTWQCVVVPGLAFNPLYHGVTTIPYADGPVVDLGNHPATLNANVAAATQYEGGALLIGGGNGAVGSGGIIVGAGGQYWQGLSTYLSGAGNYQNTLGFIFVGGVFCGFKNPLPGIQVPTSIGYQAIELGNATGLGLNGNYMLCVSTGNTTLPTEAKVALDLSAERGEVYYWLPVGETEDVEVVEGDLTTTHVLHFVNGFYRGKD